MPSGPFLSRSEFRTALNAGLEKFPNSFPYTIISNASRQTMATTKATPPTAHPACPVICGMLAELVLLAAVTDDLLEPDGLAVLKVDGIRGLCRRGCR